MQRTRSILPFVICRRLLVNNRSRRSSLLMTGTRAVRLLRRCFVAPSPSSSLFAVDFSDANQSINDFQVLLSFRICRRLIIINRSRRSSLLITGTRAVRRLRRYFVAPSSSSLFLSLPPCYTPPTSIGSVATLEMCKPLD